MLGSYQFASVTEFFLFFEGPFGLWQKFSFFSLTELFFSLTEMCFFDGNLVSVMETCFMEEFLSYERNCCLTETFFFGINFFSLTGIGFCHGKLFCYSNLVMWRKLFMSKMLFFGKYMWFQWKNKFPWEMGLSIISDSKDNHIVESCAGRVQYQQCCKGSYLVVIRWYKFIIMLYKCPTFCIRIKYKRKYNFIFFLTRSLLL